MRMFIPLFLVLFSTSQLYADTRPSALALEWWLEKQGKFKGSAVCTRETEEFSNRFVITTWKVDGVEQPTEQEVEKIIDDYNAHIQNQKDDFNKKRSDMLERFKLSEDDVKTMKEILK